MIKTASQLSENEIRHAGRRILAEAIDYAIDNNDNEALQEIDNLLSRIEETCPNLHACYAYCLTETVFIDGIDYANATRIQMDPDEDAA